MAKRYFTRNKRSFGNLNILKALSTLALAYTVSISPVCAQQITVDGKTNTSLNVNGNVTHVYTETMKGRNAFNSFNKFNVNNGKVVNLVVPYGATNLLNLVSSEQSHIEGVLNSIKSGKIGGNIFIINPYGMTVSSSGVINVGSLTAVTPTNDFVNNFFEAPGLVNDASVEAVLNGTAPINSNAVIDIQGRINAIESVKLDAGSIVNSGEIYSGAVFEENNIEVGDVVNVNTLESASDIAVNNGEIVLLATNDITNSGKIVADGGDNIDGGNIDIVADNNVYLQPGSLVSAKGKGENSSGGNIFVWGDNDSYFERGAILDARGGDISGDGGFIELSAKNYIKIDGGIFKASAINGTQGRTFIDPLNIDVGDAITDGTLLEIVATDSITVLSNVVISSRNLISTNTTDDLSGLTATQFETNSSYGDSGDIEFEAPEITIGTGAKIFSHSTGSYNAGDIYFRKTSSTAADSVTFNSGSKVLAEAQGTGSGGDITINTASSNGSGVSLGGEITTNGNVSILSRNGITQSNSNALIEANNITLHNNTGTTDIGTSETNPLKINIIDGGNLTSFIYGGDTYIEETSGDLKINEVQSLYGDIYIKANGSILDDKGTENWNIQTYTGDITLESETGTIGTNSGDGDLDISIGSYLTATTTNNNIYIEDLNSNLVINEINAGTGDVYITSTGSITQDASGTGITGDNITLTAYRIGTSNTDPLKINTGTDSTDVISATSSNEIYIKETSGDLRIGTICSYNTTDRKDIYLEAQGSILDGEHSANDPTRIWGKGITLKAGGSIGTSSDDLDIDLNTNVNTSTPVTGGVFKAEASGNIYVEENSYFSDGKELIIDSVTAGGVVELTSADEITDSTDGSAKITGTSITLDANGIIGTSSGSPLDINTSLLSADSNGYAIYIKNYGTSDLAIDSVDASTADVYITSTGSIVQYASGTGVTGDSVSLTSGDTIGSSSTDPLDINTGTAITDTLSATSANEIYIKETDGNLRIDTICSYNSTQSTRKDIYLEAQGSILDGEHTTGDPTRIWGKSITLKAGGDIGSSSDDLDIDLNTNFSTSIPITGGVFKAEASGNIYVEENSYFSDGRELIIDSVTAGGIVELTSADEITDITDDSAKITGTSITLNSNGLIGAFSSPLDINTQSLSADSNGYSIYLKNYGTSDLAIDSVDAGTGNVNIVSAGSIVDDSNDSTDDIIGNEVHLDTDGSIGSLGATDNSLDIDSNTSNSNGKLTVVADDQYVNIHHTGDNNLRLEYISAAYSDVKLVSKKSIEDVRSGDTLGLIFAKGIELESEEGSIGGSGEYDIDISLNHALTGGKLTAKTTNQDIYIEQLYNHLELSSSTGAGGIDAGTGNVYLKSAGNIVDADNNSDVNIVGNQIELTATNGNIGESTDLLEIESGTSGLSASAPAGNIYIQETGTDPTIIVNNVSAGGDIYLQADYQIQNYTGTIETTGVNKTITLATNNTQLYNGSGGEINLGNDGTVVFERINNGNLILGYGGYGGQDNPNNTEVAAGTNSYVTLYELSTITQGTTIEINSSNNTNIVDINYDFYNYPINVGNETLYIISSNIAGENLHIGDFDLYTHLMTSAGFIHQDEIDNITSDNIKIGNFSSEIGVGYNINNIFLYDPDFSTTSSTNSFSDLTLQTSGNIADNSSTETGIKAKSINLDADGYIGTSGEDVDIDTDSTNNGTITAISGGIINLHEVGGNLLVNSIDADTNTVYITSNGAILDHSDNTDNDIIGNDIILTSNGLIGYTSGDQYLEIDTNSGTLTVSSTNNNIFLKETDGNLEIASVDAGTTGNVDLVSSGNLIDATDGSANITGSRITLGANGIIGSSLGSPLDIDTQSLSADSNGNAIYLYNYGTSDLAIDSVDAGTTGDVYLTSVGSITDGNTSNNSIAKITGNNLFLTSTGGNIGADTLAIDIDDGLLEIDSTTSLNASAATGSIYIKEVGTTPTITVGSDDIIAANNIYLEAETQIQNAGNEIKADDEITLVSNNLVLTGTDTIHNNGESGGRVILDRSTSGNFTIGASGDISSSEIATILSDNIQFGRDNNETNLANVSLYDVNLENRDSAGTGYANIEINATGNIIDGESDADFDIKAKSIELTSGSNIGSSTSVYLDIDTQGGTLTANSNNNNLFIKETDGDLVLASVNTGTGDVYIVSDDNLTQSGTGTSIYGKKITLTSTNESIGTSDTNPLKIDMNTGSSTTGYLYVAAKKDIYIAETDGNMDILGVASVDRMDIYLWADQNIVDAENTSGDAARLWAKNITLISDNGSIGSSGDSDIDIDINCQSTGGVFIAEAAGNIYVEENSYFAVGKEFIIDSVTAGGIVSLTSADVITDTTDSSANITGSSIILNANGIIGSSSGSPLDIDTPSLSADSNGNAIYLYNYGTSDLAIDSVDAGTTGDVYLTSVGSITDGNTSNNSIAKITGNNINLTSTGGDIGTDTSDEDLLEIDSTTSLNASAATGSIYIKEVGTTPTITVGSDDIIAANNIYLEAETQIQNAGNTIQTTAANSTITLVSNNLNLTGSGTINNDNESGGTLILDSSSSINLSVGGSSDDITSSELGAIRADNIQIGQNNAQNITIDQMNLYNLDSAGIGYANAIIQAQGSILDNSDNSTNDITAKNITLTSNGLIGYSSGDQYLEIDTNSGTLTASSSGNDIFITETTGNLEVVSVNAGTTGDVDLVSSGNLTDGTGTSISGNNITIETTGSISESANYLGINSNTNGDGKLTATSNNSDIYIEETSGNLPVNSVNAGTGDVYITSAGSILDGNTASTDAKIKGDNISLTAGSDSNIGTDSTDAGLLEINSGSSLSADATAGTTGKVFIKQVGDNSSLDSSDKIIVDSITADEEIYLQADWEIENHGGTIQTTADNSTITLVTHNTQLYDVSLSSPGDISTGTDGVVVFSRASKTGIDGDIYISCPDVDEDSANSDVGDPTHVTVSELGTISNAIIMADPPSGGSVQWGNATGQKIIIDDDYDFLTYGATADEIYILRLTPGDFKLGYVLDGNGDMIDGDGIINQNEIDNITADKIHFGNVLQIGSLPFADTENIYLYDPDFSATSSTSGASDITLAASNSILDGTPLDDDTSDDSGTYTYTLGLKANNLTMRAAFEFNDSDPDSSNNYDTTTDATRARTIGTIEEGTSDTTRDTYSSNLDIDLQGTGKLEAKTYGEISIYETYSDMYLERVESLNDSILLASVWNIFDASDDDSTPVTDILAAKDIKLKAGYWTSNHDIGTNTGYIEIDTDTNADSYVGSLSAYGLNIYAEEMEGNLAINKMTGIYPFAMNSVYLKANDSNGADILDANNQIGFATNQEENRIFNIISANTILEAKYGSVGIGDIGTAGAIDIYDKTILKVDAGNASGHTDTETVNIMCVEVSVSNPILYIDKITTNAYSNVYLKAEAGYIGDYSVEDTNEVTDIETHNLILETNNYYSDYVNLIPGSGAHNAIGYIGSTTQRRLGLELLNNAVNDGKIKVAATSNITLLSRGDMNIDEIIANSGSSKVSLYTLENGSILDAKDRSIDSSPNIDVADITLLSDNSVGTNSKPLQINASQQIHLNYNADLNNSTDGGVYISSDEDIIIGFCEIDSEIVLTTNSDSSSDIIFEDTRLNGFINTYDGTNYHSITLNSDGDILSNYSSSYNLKGTSIDLTAAGSIGSATEDIVIQWTGADDPDYTYTGSLYIDETEF